MKQPSFIQSLYYQQGVAQQPNDCTRQTPPRAKRPRGHRLSSVAQRWCLDRPTVPIIQPFGGLFHVNVPKLLPRHDEIIWYWGGFSTRHVTIASRPLEKTALRRGPSPVPVQKGGPAYGRSEYR